ncbi:MAG: hypothetical protein QM728_10305 [Gordonia sp. (in: high G+C Gram-positive bacteria)]|uniref:hypothetical protein n=1 Tax=Gordonia sp. (in: high G+C Gram-positive bacteria) TaxID=84139 RepID=UPI0039E48C92
MFGKFSRSAAAAAVGLATAAALTAGLSPAHGAPLPPRAPAAPGAPGSPSVPDVQLPGAGNGPVPYDSQLAMVVKFLKSVGGDRLFVEIVQALIGSAGQLAPSKPAGAQVASVKMVDAVSDPLTLLRQAGVQPLSPAVAPFCAAPTPDNPLGIVNAGTAAIPGPWPVRKDSPLTPLMKLPFPLPGIEVPDPNIVKDKQTAFAFIPAETTIAGKRGTMRVAWFNTATMRGGVNELTPLADNNPMIKILPGISGVRLTPVDTGKGTVLAAVYGTAGAAGNRECFFLPSVGVVNS